MTQIGNKDPCFGCGFVTCECTHKLVPLKRGDAAVIWRDEEGRWYVEAGFTSSSKDGTSAGIDTTWTGPRAMKRTPCPICKSWISVGEPIDRLGTDWVHAICAAPVNTG